MLIVPLTKSPHTSGRVGPMVWQDWYRGLAKAKALLGAHPASKISIISDVHIAGEPHEADRCLAALAELAVAESNIEVIRKAQETIEQVEIAGELARTRGEGLVIISTFLHYPRVRWLCWRLGVNARHRVAWGIPRPREALTDIVLWIIFPIVDLFGGREWFRSRVTTRRTSGTF